jgi:hypothetical protein
VTRSYNSGVTHTISTALHELWRVPTGEDGFEFVTKIAEWSRCAPARAGAHCFNCSIEFLLHRGFPAKLLLELIALGSGVSSYFFDFPDKSLAYLGIPAKLLNK